MALMQKYWDTRYDLQRYKTVCHCSYSDKEFEIKTKETRKVIIDHFKNLFTSKKVLDIGCGYGRLISILLLIASQVYGIDISPWAITEARKHIKNATFDTYDGKTIPFSDGFFEGALSWTVLQHIPGDEIENICREISRILKPESALMLYENTSTWIPDKPHIWFRSYEEYIALFHDFQIEYSDINLIEDNSNERHCLMVMRKR